VFQYKKKILSELGLDALKKSKNSTEKVDGYKLRALVDEPGNAASEPVS
jgi:hypothetical protein